MRNLPRVLIYLIILFSINLCLDSKLHGQNLPAIFTDGMVLQQNTEAAIWGTANANTDLQITTGWNQRMYEVVSDSTGYWKVEVSTPEGGFEEFDITIRGEKSITIRRVLIGEVWLASGQSNMQMPVKGYLNQPVENSMDILMEAKNPYIRLFEVERNSVLEPVFDAEGTWKASDVASVKEFSAIASVFGKILFNKLNVPVGLIGSYWGGSSVDAWMNKKTLKNYPSLNPDVQKNQSKAANRIPTALYNGMIVPIQPYTMKGIIWYQGESDRNRYELYANLFPDMIRSWRNEWGDNGMPFYYAQIAPFAYDSSHTSAFLREAQLQTVETVSNVGMAVTLDIGEQFNIHPADKITVAERLSYLALSKTYGVSGLPYSGPVYRDMDIQENKIYLLFEYATNGLTTFGEKLTDFKIAGSDKIFYKADTQIVRYEGNPAIVVWNDSIPDPKAVRYCFEDWCEGNVYNTEGLPASSFRTDDWDELK
mgnify:CR=1 FL=1